MLAMATKLLANLQAVARILLVVKLWWKHFRAVARISFVMEVLPWKHFRTMARISFVIEVLPWKHFRAVVRYSFVMAGSGIGIRRRSFGRFRARRGIIRGIRDPSWDHSRDWGSVAGSFARFQVVA